jgi:transglutaminase-like putative cysteine protease
MMQSRKNKKTTFITLVILSLAVSSTSMAWAAVTPGYVSSWARESMSKGISYDILPASFENQNMNQITSRLEFAQVTVKLYESIKGSKVSTPTTNPFSDTQDPSVLKAYSLGIVKGVGNGLFDPQGVLTREQAATMLTRVYTKATGNRLTATGVRLFEDDSQISTYARPSIYYMVYKEFVQGTGNNRFTPKGMTTREQTIAMAVRMLDEVNGEQVGEPGSEYVPGMRIDSVEVAQSVILEAKRSLLPSLSLGVPRRVYDELLTSSFAVDNGIKSVYYLYDAGNEALDVRMTYSVHTQIQALIQNPGSTSLYASQKAKELNLMLSDILRDIIISDMNTLEKEKAVHDYMVRNYQYDTSVTVYDLEHPSQSVEGLLYYGKGICQGYAEMFDLMMQKMGISSRMVRGEYSGQKHVWNMVLLSGEWYMVDVTWNDPIPDQGVKVSHEYFNVTSEFLAKTHEWDRAAYPEATGTRYR